MDYVTDLFRFIITLPDDSLLEIDRVHRTIPRQSGMAPPDILARVHFFKLKEEIMRKARSMQQITFRGSNILLYQDLASSTLQKRKGLKPLTEWLQERKVLYRWGFPTSVRFTWEGTQRQIHSMKEVEKLMGIAEAIGESDSEGPPQDLAKKQTAET